MSRHRCLHVALWLLLCSRTTATTDCLATSVPKQNRSYIQDNDGADIAIRFLEMDWDSSVMTTAIARIILEEVLGYHTAAEDVRATRTRYALFALAGCTTYSNAEDPGCVAKPNSRIHVAMDTWVGTNAADWDEVQLLYNGRAPQDLGSIGYSGREHMAVKKQTVAEAYEAEAVPLDFYKGYNASHHAAHKYFDSIFDIDWSCLKPCHFPESNFQHPGAMATYLRVTGDRGGLLEVSDGQFIANCQHTHWWVAPACRHNASECVPVVTYGTGYRAHTFMQWSAFHNMPLAIAVARDWDLYVHMVKQSHAAFYMWIPDVTFSDFAQPVLFPEHSAKEWEEGLMRTAAAGSYVNKISSWDLRYKAERAVKFLEKFQLGTQELHELLLDVTRSNSTDPVEAVACKWVRENQGRFRRWIPLSTNCGLGFGLANDDGMHVLTRAEATGCSICMPGQESVLFMDDDGSSHRCSRCPPGKFQNEAGQLTCTNCAPGSISRAAGAVECELCPMGQYANSSGLTACTVCDAENPDLTTTRPVQIDGRSSWLQFQGASSQEFCTCPPESFLHHGKCQKCQRGSFCPGSGKIELLPGFYSTKEDPGSVFECFDTPERCPGGKPGLCAPGRDTSSLACSRCLPGWYERMETCLPCQSGDYALIVVVFLAATATLVTLHLVVICSGQGRQQFRSLVSTGLALSQMIFFVQVLSTIRLFNITWGEPFVSIMQGLQAVAADRVLRSLSVFSCLSRVEPLTAYISATLLAPAFMLFVPLLTHLLYLACRRHTSLKLGQLGKTCGMLYVLFFITLCANLIGPFRCHTHPNGKATLKAFDGVLCNMEGRHWRMCLVGGFGFLVPIGFLALCCWILFFEYPKRVARLDAKFMRATAFLTFRFRPGKERYAMLFLVRDTLIVLCPLLSASSASIVCLTLIMYMNLLAVALEKPWRLPQANFLSLLVMTAILSLLDLGSFFVEATDNRTMMLASGVITSTLVAATLCLAVHGVVKHFASAYRKQYRFFLCHHKAAAGSLARLLKIQFRKRGPNFSAFVDTDDLTDLANLFALVSNQVQTLVVLASSEILRRKWCVGEMATAHVNKVETVLVLLPGFEKPTSAFIQNYLYIVPEIKDLSGYNISIAEVQSTMTWLRTLEVLELSSLATPEALEDVVTRLTATPGLTQSEAEGDGTECVIMADPDNMEAMATAYVLFALLCPRMLKDSGMSPRVLTAGCNVADNVKSVLLICSQDCLESEQVAKWLLQTSHVEACSVLPIIAEDSFQFPANSSIARLLEHGSLQHLDLQTYVRLVRCIFEEVAICFSARGSSAMELNLRLDQLALRLRTSRPKSLSSRFSSDGLDDWQPRHSLENISDGGDIRDGGPFRKMPRCGSGEGGVDDTDANSVEIADAAFGEGPLVEEVF